MARTRRSGGGWRAAGWPTCWRSSPASSWQSVTGRRSRAPPSWPITFASPLPAPRWSGWSGWPGPAGRSRTATSRPRVRSVWTTTRSAAGRAGTGTSPWRCWPTPSWSSPVPGPPAATAQRGTRRPDRGARPAPAHRSRGPPLTGSPGVVSTGPAGPGAGLVTLAPTPPGPSATRTLPATRTASAAGVLGAAVSDAVRQAAVRAVIASGWGGLRGVHDDAEVLVIERAPHRWLFPRVAAVVHHGGAGTTAAGLLAARPTVVCPFQGDQHFWGAAVHRAWRGPPPR